MPEDKDRETLEAQEWREKFKARVRLFAAAGAAAGAGARVHEPNDKPSSPHPAAAHTVGDARSRGGQKAAQSRDTEGGEGEEEGVMEHVGRATFRALGNLVGEVKHGVEEGVGELLSQLSPVTSPNGRPVEGDASAQEEERPEREHGRGGAGRREGAEGEGFGGAGRGFGARGSGTEGGSAAEAGGETQHAKVGDESLSVSVDADARAAFLEALQTYKAKMSQLQAAVTPQQGAAGAAGTGSPPSPTSPPASLERRAAARACKLALYTRLAD